MTSHAAACVNYRTSQASTSSGPYCSTCGTSLYVSGFARYATSSRPRPRLLRDLQQFAQVGYNGAPLKRGAREHPCAVMFAVLFSVIFIASFFDDANTSQSSANTSQSPGQTLQLHEQHGNSSGGLNGSIFTKYPCDFRDKGFPD